MSEGSFTRWVSELARTHTKRLASTAAAEGLSPSDAIDAVQEAFHTFLSLPQARSLAFVPDDSARLLTVITRNAARNMRRRHHRSRAHEDIDELDQATNAASSEELVAQANEHARLLGCINVLAEVQRHVVTLRMLEEMSATDVAHTLKLEPAHVAVLLYRAKKQLQHCLLA